MRAALGSAAARPEERKSPAPAGFREFVGLMAMLTALMALSIDTILPALPSIGSSLGVVRPNDNQLIVSLLFLGIAIGQFFYGPVSDSVGRKPAVYAGLGLYMSGCALSLASRTFPLMLAGRLLQGLGAAGPRVMTIALVRDRFEGRLMARVMSLIMTIFILVPVVAPSLGQGILLVSGWRTIFGLYFGLALAACVWFAVRQEETLPRERRVPFSTRNIAHALRIVVSSRIALGYTLAAGCVFGAFIGYLGSAQQIFQQRYGLGARFPLYFALLAIAIGSASFASSRLVMRYGARHLSGWAMRTLFGISVAFLGFAYSANGFPPLVALLGYLMLSFFCVGLLMGNLNALAMQPLGHVAGTGAAMVGGLSTLISLVLGTIVGQSYNETVLPLVTGFAILAASGLVAMRWAETGSLHEM